MEFIKSKLILYKEIVIANIIDLQKNLPNRIIVSAPNLILVITKYRKPKSFAKLILTIKYK